MRPGEPTIISLAILKVNWDRGHDYIDNFVPFVAECLRIAVKAEVTVPELQQSMRTQFGLQVPQHALRTILNRAVRRDFATRSGGAYHRNDAALTSLDFNGLRGEALIQHEALVARLVQYVRRHNVVWTNEQAEGALLSYVQQKSAPILSMLVEGTPIPSPERLATDSDFLVNSFIAHLFSEDIEGFSHLETVVKGAMLSSVLLFPDVSAALRHFSRLEVYLDTPFLLPALGLLGSSRAAPCTELLNLLYEENVDLRIFEHTLDELQGVLQASANALNAKARLRHAFGDVVEYFIEARYTPSDVELFIARLPEVLRTLHIQIKAKPPHTQQLGINEPKLEAMLTNEMNYRRHEALQRDIDSLASIHRLRQGRTVQHIESCEALLLTTNPVLARVGAQFFKEEYDGASVPLCVLDYDLGTIAWLKKPLSIPDLPRKQIIADCYAAMRPPELLWKKYLSESNRLLTEGQIKAQDYYLLRFSTEARAVLMELTRGHESRLTPTTVPEILQLARAAVTADLEAELRAERERSAALEAAKAADRSQSEAEIRLEREARLQAQRKAGSAEAVIQSQLQAIRKWATRLSSIAVACISVVWFAVLVGAVYRGMWSLVGQWDYLNLLAIGMLLIVLSITALNMAFGRGIRGLLRRFKVYMARRIEEGLRKALRVEG